jgi:hypothetical protein
MRRRDLISAALVAAIGERPMAAQPNTATVAKVHLAIMLATLTPSYRQDFLTYANPTSAGPQVLQDIYNADSSTYTQVRNYFMANKNSLDGIFKPFQTFFQSCANQAGTATGAGTIYGEPQQCPCLYSGAGKCPAVSAVLNYQPTAQSRKKG